MIHIEIILEAILILIIFWITSMTILNKRKILWAVPFFIFISMSIFEIMISVSSPSDNIYNHGLWASFTLVFFWIVLNIFRGKNK